jgi:hypothetical protein
MDLRKSFFPGSSMPCLIIEQVLEFFFLFLYGMLLAMQAEAVPLVEELKLVEDSGAEMYAFLPFHVFVHQ